MWYWVVWAAERCGRVANGVLAGLSMESRHARAMAWPTWSAWASSAKRGQAACSTLIRMGPMSADSSQSIITQVAVKRMHPGMRDVVEAEVRAVLALGQNECQLACRYLGLCIKDNQLCIVMKRYSSSLAAKIPPGMHQRPPAGPHCHYCLSLHAVVPVAQGIGTSTSCMRPTRHMAPGCATWHKAFKHMCATLQSAVAVAYVLS